MLDREIVITFDTAKLAKEKGFLSASKAYNLEGKLGNYYDIVGECPFDPEFEDDENAIDYDQLRYSAPSQSLLQKWLREEHKINIWCIPMPNNITWMIKGRSQNNELAINEFSESYEEALEEGLTQALKLIN